MANFSFFKKPYLPRLGLTAAFLSLPYIGSAQQVRFQLPLLPSLAHAAAFEGDDLPDDTGDSYLTSVSKSGQNSFHPTSSDLLIEQAEQHYDNGRRAFQNDETETARREFDAAVDLMLQASEGPSDRALYQSKLERMVDSIHRLDLARLGAGATDQNPQFEKAPLDNILQMTFPVDPTIKDKVLGEVKATASALPLTVNDAVLSYIHYFSGRGRNTMIAGLQRAGKYRPMIERVLREEGVPLELMHLAQAESGFLPRAVSNRAATGMWQFVKFRGQEYGLNQSLFSDDRLDPEKATRAAARHLRDLYNRYGDWYLAIAAYNCGPGNIDKAVERTGYADFWELRARHAIPVETTNYVPIILAMTIMTKNAAEYDLEGIVPETPLEYDTITLDSTTHLALVGDLTDTPVSQLIGMNPALLKPMAPAGYALHVPRGAAEQLVSALDRVPADHRTSWRMHRVLEGETLADIAKHFGATASEIASVNKLTSTAPITGDALLIPAAFHSDAPARVSAHRGKQRYASASRSRATVARLSASRSRTRTTLARLSGSRSRTASLASSRTRSAARLAPVRHTLARRSVSRKSRAA